LTKHRQHAICHVPHSSRDTIGGELHEPNSGALAESLRTRQLCAVSWMEEQRSDIAFEQQWAMNLQFLVRLIGANAASDPSLHRQYKQHQSDAALLSRMRMNLLSLATDFCLPVVTLSKFNSSPSLKP
jgi:hypothetical protein